MNILEHNFVIAYTDMLPAIDQVPVPGPSDGDKSDEEGSVAGGDIGDEAWGFEGDDLWSKEGEEISEDHFVERIPGLERNSSEEEAMLKFLGPLTINF